MEVQQIRPIPIIYQTKRPTLMLLAILTLVIQSSCADGFRAASQDSFNSLSLCNEGSNLRENFQKANQLLDNVPTGAILITPNIDYCAVLNSAKPGDFFSLASGRYLKACRLDRINGTSEEPIIIQSENSNLVRRAVLAYPGSSSNVLEIHRSSHIKLIDLAFDGSDSGVAGVRIKRSKNIELSGNYFSGMGGVAITANQSNTKDIHILNNTFWKSKATAIYIGQHDGSKISQDFKIIGNYINGVTSSNVGYGIEVKLNSFGEVSYNSIYNTKGPSIMFYGLKDPQGALTKIESNYIESYNNDAGINLAGGPVLVQNNIVTRSRLGIWTQNYANRNLHYNVKIIHNTLFYNELRDLDVRNLDYGAKNIVINNAIIGHVSSKGFLPPKSGALLAGNITCDFNTDCLTKLEVDPLLKTNFLPTSGGLLFGAAVRHALQPTLDFLGQDLPSSAHVGALQDSTDLNLGLLGVESPRPLISSDSSSTSSDSPKIGAPPLPENNGQGSALEQCR